MRIPPNKNNVWCHKWHLRAVYGCNSHLDGGRECRECRRLKSADYRARTRNPSAVRSLWDDDGAEYWFLRRDLGMSPREIGEKHGVKWTSFQRTLWRRVGGKASW